MESGLKEEIVLGHGGGFQFISQSEDGDDGSFPSFPSLPVTENESALAAANIVISLLASIYIVCDTTQSIYDWFPFWFLAWLLAILFFCPFVLVTFITFLVSLCNCDLIPGVIGSAIVTLAFYSFAGNYWSLASLERLSKENFFLNAARIVRSPGSVTVVPPAIFNWGVLCVECPAFVWIKLVVYMLGLVFALLSTCGYICVPRNVTSSMRASTNKDITMSMCLQVYWIFTQIHSFVRTSPTGVNRVLLSMVLDIMYLPFLFAAFGIFEALVFCRRLCRDSATGADWIHKIISFLLTCVHSFIGVKMYYILHGLRPAFLVIEDSMDDLRWLFACNAFAFIVGLVSYCGSLMVNAKFAIEKGLGGGMGSAEQGESPGGVDPVGGVDLVEKVDSQ